MRNNLAALLSLCGLLAYTASAASPYSNNNVNSVSHHHSSKHVTHSAAHSSHKTSLKNFNKKKHTTKHSVHHSSKNSIKYFNSSIRSSLKHSIKKGLQHTTKSIKHTTKHTTKKGVKHTTKKGVKHTTKKGVKHTTKKGVKHTTKHTTKKGIKHTTKKPISNKSYPKHKIIAYVLDWSIPKDVKWNEVDHIAYAFAEPNVNGTLKGFDSKNLKSVVTQAHKHNVGVSISVAGWSGSIHMSSLLSTNETRQILVKNIVNMVNKYSLDGVNLDWEFPNNPDSISCSSRDANDTPNFLTFIQLLREQLDAKFSKVHKVITVAASTNTFNDNNGRPTQHFDAGWISAVDYFYLMSYEYNGIWNDVAGPNSPLTGSDRSWGVDTTVNFWYNAGIPKEKMHVGIALYGKVLKTSEPITASSGMYVKNARQGQAQGDKYDELSADPCPGASYGYTGEYQYRSIVKNGILENKNGWTTYWDDQSQTPYAFHDQDSIFLTYDNSKSLEAKVDYVKSQGLAGFMVWSLEMDDSKHTLLQTIQRVRN